MSKSKTEKLIAQGMVALSSCNPELAVQFFHRASESSPSDSNILDALADALIQCGRLDEARDALTRSTGLSPALNPVKWFSLGQLQSGSEALASYSTGIRHIEREIEICGDEGTRMAYRMQLSRAYASIAELFLTDLCLQDNAESLCESACASAITAHPASMDARLTQASLRMSQCRIEEAANIVSDLAAAVLSRREAEAARTIIDEMRTEGRTEEEEEGIEVGLILSLAKILIECSAARKTLASHAVELLAGLLDDDDEIVDAWILLGIALANSEPIDLEEAKNCLERAKDLIDCSRLGNDAEERGDRQLGKEAEEKYAAVLIHLENLAHGRPIGVVRSAIGGVRGADDEWSDDDDC